MNQNLTTLKQVPHTDLQAKCYEHDMVILGDSGHVWSPMMMIVTTVTFLTVRALVVDAMAASMRCQYTTNRNMEFVHIYVAMTTSMKFT